MKRFLTYVTALVLAFACTKAPELIIPQEEDGPSTPEGPKLSAIYVMDSSISLESGGHATLHFRVEAPDCQFSELLLMGTDGKTPELFHLVSFEKSTESGHYVADIVNDSSDSYIRTAKLRVMTGEESYIDSQNFVVKGKGPRPGMVHTGLPVVFVDTQGGAAITSKEQYVSAKFSICGATAVESITDVDCSIRGRGNTTWEWPKKPYLVKLEEKASVFGFPAHKRWVLLANFMDRTMMRNMVAMKVSSMTRLAWTPRSQTVELVLNGKHVGNYLLIEQVRVDGDRVNIDKKDGYLLELDFHYDNTFQWKDHNIPFAVKHPDPDEPTELTQEKKTYIKNYIAEVSNVIYGSNFKDPVNGYAKYLDVDSFIDYWIIFEVMTNHELGNPGSVFMHKDKDGKLTAGPCWDFDWGVLTFDTTGGDRRLINRHAIWYDRLFQDPAFLQKTRDRIRELLPQLQTIPDFIDECEALLSESAKLNFQMWNPAEDASMNSGKIINGDERMTFHYAVDRIKKNYNIHLQFVLDNL